MNKKRPVQYLLTILISLSLCIASSAHLVKASEFLSFVVLSDYTKTMNINEEFYLIAVTSDLSKPMFKSSSSSIASVNTYGMITAKKAGIATITAKIKEAEASCKVTVTKTKITLSETNLSIERNESVTLTAKTSNNSSVTWKSNKKGTVEVDENGKLYGIKPGEALITAISDNSSAVCKVNVREPRIKLNKTSLTLFRGQTFLLNADVSSKVAPVWKSNKSSVALIDNSGLVTAVKHGTALITAKVDGISKICEVTVKSPVIRLSKEKITLREGNSQIITAEVSSGNQPIYSSSNSNVAAVDEKGCVTALKKGNAYIYATEDGTKVRCRVTVTK